MRPDTIILKTKYKIWRNPIKWWKERKMLKIMQFIFQKEYEKMEPEIAKAKTDLFLYGHTILKDGKHVRFNDHGSFD
jgi:hypothetical protein